MKIVIVGGGAGGLELATRLGRKLGRKGAAEILLIDRNSTHVWKPLLHEVASGSLDASVDEVGYRGHAYQHGFSFKLGSFDGIDRDRKCVRLAAFNDNGGKVVLPAREEPYDFLVLAIGSVSNDFSVPGVADHCSYLDATTEAEEFHDNLVNRFVSLNHGLSKGVTDHMHIAIVGGGATGVELSAELLRAREWFATYGLTSVTQDHMVVSLIEAGPRLLPALSEPLSATVEQELAKIGVTVKTGTQIACIEENSLITKTGEKIQADVIVWAAGIKAPDMLLKIEGLQTNRMNQLLVEPTLQVKGDEAIFAIGDCAGLLYSEQGVSQRWVPPRAQSAHQMASLVAKNLIHLSKNKPLKEFKYKDYGSLVSLSDYTAVGKLMGGVAGGSMNIQGRIARISYISLYRMHQIALHGLLRTMLFVFADQINRFIRPRLKLH